MPGLTAELGRFVAGLEPASLPTAAHRTVRRGIVDCMGVLFAGRGEPVVRQVLSTLSVSANAGGSSVLGDRGYAASSEAAFVNSVAAHALDYDDTGLDGHPSVVLAPVVLAEGERSGATWLEAGAAYVAGYEVWAELIARDPDKHHGKGWHPTAVFGTVAAAAASARLRGLTAERCAAALGIAASMAGGLVANFGSMTKPLQVGLAARNGIAAACYAEHGITAAPDALESPRGFLAALSPGGRVRLGGPIGAGSVWQIVAQGLNIKRYPVCYAVHRTIDAALELRARLDQRLGEIEAIEVSMGRLQAAMLRNSRPRTGLEARFSAEFAVACALLHGHVGLADLDDARVSEEDIQRLQGRVQVLPLQEQDAEEPLFSPFDTVRVRFRDGESISATPVHRAKGHASLPLTDVELQAKFLDCGRSQLGDAAALAWWQALWAAPADSTLSWANQGRANVGPLTG